MPQIEVSAASPRSMVGHAYSRTWDGFGFSHFALMPSGCGAICRGGSEHIDTRVIDHGRWWANRQERVMFLSA
eukprot:6177731-Pleurochrysis_carterae.AAC.2